MVRSGRWSFSSQYRPGRGEDQGALAGGRPRSSAGTALAEPGLAWWAGPSHHLLGTDTVADLRLKLPSDVDLTEWIARLEEHIGPPTDRGTTFPGWYWRSRVTRITVSEGEGEHPHRIILADPRFRW